MRYDAYNLSYQSSYGQGYTEIDDNRSGLKFSSIDSEYFRNTLLDPNFHRAAINSLSGVEEASIKSKSTQRKFQICFGIFDYM